MFSMLLAIIYLAFISLGLPDSLLGSAWPVMRLDLQVSLSSAGIITMIISVGTIISSLLSGRLLRKLGTGRLTAFSVGLTAVALLGFSFSNSFFLLCLMAIPYGLGAGAVDAALNHYVAVHYSSRHMSWLHAFWGVGVSISPLIMGFSLSRQLGWQMGYRYVSIIQFALFALLMFKLPLWRGKDEQQEESINRVLSVNQALKVKGVPYILIAFFSFCALEATTGLWAASYLVGHRGVLPEQAARFNSLFFVGIMTGRFLNGFAAEKFGDRAMIRAGCLVMLLGIVLLLLPVSSSLPALLGFLVIGFGSAPVYPCIIHSTPDNFGRENAQSLVGIQMASAYLGITLIPPLMGLLAQAAGIRLYPQFLLVFLGLLLFMTERLNKLLDQSKEQIQAK